MNSMTNKIGGMLYRVLLPMLWVWSTGIPTAVQGQTIQAKVIPERDSLVVGDPLNLVLNIQAPKGVVIKVPSIEAIFEEQLAAQPEGDFLELLEVSDLSSRETADFNVFEQQVVITGWNEQMYQFPPLTFIAERGGQVDSFVSEPVAIRVKFPTPVTGDSTYVADIKPPLEEPTYWSDYLIYVWIGLGGVLIAGAVVLIVYLSGKRKPQPQAAASPEEWALRQLDQLMEEKGKGEQFQAAISFILRQYLNNRYQLAALEATTAEILPQVAACAPLKSYLKGFEEVLETADLVKFAKASPLEAAHIFAADFVHKIIGIYVAQMEDEAAERGRGA